MVMLTDITPADQLAAMTEEERHELYFKVRSEVEADVAFETRYYNEKFSRDGVVFIVRKNNFINKIRKMLGL